MACFWPSDLPYNLSGVGGGKDNEMWWWRKNNRNVVVVVVEGKQKNEEGRRGNIRIEKEKDEEKQK